MTADPTDVPRARAAGARRSLGAGALIVAAAIAIVAWGCFAFDLIVPIYPRNFTTLPIPLGPLLIGEGLANVLPLVLSIRALRARSGVSPAVIALVMASIGVLLASLTLIH